MKKILFMTAALTWALTGCASAGQEPDITAAEEIRQEGLSPADDGLPEEGKNENTKTENEGLDLPVLTEPPMMKVQYQGEEITCRSGGYEWTSPGEDDEMLTLAACGAHPLDMNFEKIIYLDNTESKAEIKLTFEVLPQTVTARYWDGQYRQKAWAYSEKYTDCPVTETEGGYLLTVPGNKMIVMEIYAVWEKEQYSGNAGYGLAVGPRGVTMFVKAVTDESIKAVFENSTDQEVIYGEDYFLEMKKDGTWQELPYATGGAKGYHDLAYIVLPGKTSECMIDYQWLYGTLEKGEYRLVKNIIMSTDAPPGETVILPEEKVTLTAEFTV